MLAIVNTPGGAAPVAIGEVAEPVPAADEAVVAVHAFSLNRGELRLFETRPAGWRPGQDIAGFVTAAAADGSGPPAGARVVALTDQAGWAQRVAAPARRIAVLPESAGFAAAAALPVAGLTALRTLRHGGPLLGKRVLVTGAAGGVGNLAVQLAARAGARVTAIVGSTERARALAGLGAADIVTAIGETAGPFDLILEAVGGTALNEAIARIAPGGTVVIFGNSSNQPANVSFRDFAEHQNARIQSFFYFTAEPEERFAPDLALLAALVGDGSLRPRVVEHDWRGLAAAAVRLRDRQIDGKAIFRIEQS